MSALRFPEAFSRKWTLAALLLLTAIAAALRFYGLNSELWYDEIKTLLESVRPPLSTTLTDFPSNNDHPFFSLLSHLSVAMFGEQPWTVRLPAALFGIASVPMLYLFGKDAAGRFEALLAAALLTFSYHHVVFSQSARGYSMLLFFTLATSWLLLKAVRTPGLRPWLLYAVAATLGCYTHLTMIYVVASHGLIVGANWLMGQKGKFDLRPLYLPALGFGLFAVSTLALYLPLFSGVEAYVEEKSGGTSTQIATPAWAVLAAIEGLSEGFGGLIGAGLALALLLLGFLSYAARTPMIAAMYVAPAPLVVLSALLLGHAVRPRFLFVLAGFALLMLARGAVIAGRSAESRLSASGMKLPDQSIALAAVAAILFASAASLPRNYETPKQNFTSAIALIERNAANGARGHIIGNAAKVAVNDYYGRAYPVIETAADLEGITGRFVVALTFREYVEKGAPDLWAALRGRCAEAASFPGTIAGGEVYVYECAAANAD